MRIFPRPSMFTFVSSPRWTNSSRQGMNSWNHSRRHEMWREAPLSNIQKSSSSATRKQFSSLLASRTPTLSLHFPETINEIKFAEFSWLDWLLPLLLKFSFRSFRMLFGKTKTCNVARLFTKIARYLIYSLKSNQLTVPYYKYDRNPALI